MSLSYAILWVLKQRYTRWVRYIALSKYSLLLVYMQVFSIILLLISSKYCSKLRAIQLLAIAKTSIIVKYGADTVLQKFMEELKTLEKVYHKAIIYILKLLSGRNTA